MNKTSLSIESVSKALMRPVDSSTLATFRIAFGLCLVWSVVTNFLRGRIKSKYIDREFYFTYPYFDWVEPLPGDGMYILFAIVGVSALLIAIGLFYRLASIVFLLSYAYIFLLDQADYNNHYYLICLLAFLFCLTHANRWMALDSLWKRKFGINADAGWVPYWNVFILKVQIVIVYFYSGIAKINTDWLRGEPMRGWTRNWVEFLPHIPDFLDSELSIYMLSYGGLIFDLAIGFLLWQRKTRLVGIAMAVIFHLTNHWMLYIGIFPFLMIGSTVLFLEPETPRKFLEKIITKLKKNTVVNREKKTRFPRLAIAFVAVYLAVQLLLPLRHWLYAGNVAWTEEGHDFAWRMMLQTKHDCSFIFIATNPETGETWSIYPAGHLDKMQLYRMCEGPLLIAQYAHYLGKRLQENGVENPIIRVKTKVSLNFRPYQEIIDPKVNLLEVDISPFRHADWIVPLEELR